MYDIAIIGAGPAGSTLTRLIARTHKVLLIDKRTPDTDAKCCGGLLAPDAQQMLARLGLGLPKDVLSEPQLFVVRAIDLPGRLEQYYQRHYINIDRLKFDQWLLSLIPSGVDIRTNCAFQSFTRIDNGFELRLAQGDKVFIEQARILIGADGAGSQVRRQAFPDAPLPKTYTAIQEWFEIDQTPPYFSAIFDSEITDFYSWLIPKANAIMLGSAIYPQPKSYAKFELLKKKLADYGFRFGQSLKTRGCLLFRPVKASHICLGKGNIGLIGEAAGFISPSSAEGLSYALKSGLAMTQALHIQPDKFIEHYDNATGSLRTNIILKNLKSPFMYWPLLRRSIMRLGLNNLRINAD